MYAGKSSIARDSRDQSTPLRRISYEVRGAERPAHVRAIQRGYRIVVGVERGPLPGDPCFMPHSTCRSSVRTSARISPRLRSAGAHAWVVEGHEETNRARVLLPDVESPEPSSGRRSPEAMSMCWRGLPRTSREASALVQPRPGTVVDGGKVHT